MQKLNRTRAICLALVVVALFALSFAGAASAKLTGAFTRFQQCPYTTAEVTRCLYSVTDSGVTVLGSKEVPIVNPVTLQGGISRPTEQVSKFFAATNGISLSKAAQPVPGGLSGLVNCKKISNFLLRVSCEVTLENGFTGLNATLELAKPATDIRVSQGHLGEEEGVALEMPVKVHLENPFLGSGCYVGSGTSPIIWKLTSGTTAPPGPNTPISGNAGLANFLEEGQVLEEKEVKLVDNAWSAPGASGCGGAIVELILDPIINAAAGVPAEAGHNTAILNNTISLATTAAVSQNNAEHP